MILLEVRAKLNVSQMDIGTTIIEKVGKWGTPLPQREPSPVVQAFPS